MRKTLLIIATVAVLGMIAANIAPSNAKKKSATTSQTISSENQTISESPKTTNTTPVSSSAPAATSTPKQTAGYKDGTYTGQTDSNDYEDIRVSVTIANGKITDAIVSSSASEGRSREIVSFASTQLVDETKNAQNANIDTISGATATSDSYIRSLQSALDQARRS